MQHDSEKQDNPIKQGSWFLCTSAMYCCVLNWCMAMDLRKVIDIRLILYDRGGQLDDHPEIVRHLGRAGH